ncbi:MAG: GDP-mannose 4,6-dehydratase, partial [Chloroflexi bacterium]|nr:GDP-mannose 4,6-dehydratase [Chloroflexota bacterium]
SEVYGDPLEHPQRESYWGNVNSVGPRSCYDEGKRFAEALTMTYDRQYGLDIRIVRIFNTYGPHSQPQDGRVIPNFITQALKGEPITVYGDGLQTRSFCYVSDLVKGLIRAMTVEEARGEIINLGNPEERSVLEVANLIKSLTGTTSPIIYTMARQEEITRRRPDITKAQCLLGWQPRVALEDGLRQTIVWFNVLAQEKEGL